MSNAIFLFFFSLRALCIGSGAIGKHKNFQCELSSLKQEIQKEELRTIQADLLLLQRRTQKQPEHTELTLVTLAHELDTKFRMSFCPNRLVHDFMNKLQQDQH